MSQFFEIKPNLKDREDHTTLCSHFLETEYTFNFLKVDVVHEMNMKKRKIREVEEIFKQ